VKGGGGLRSARPTEKNQRKHEATRGGYDERERAVGGNDSHTKVTLKSKSVMSGQGNVERDGNRKELDETIVGWTTG